MDYKNPFFLTVLDKGYNSIEAAKNLLRMKLGTYEQIAQAQNLSVEEVKQLALEIE